MTESHREQVPTSPELRQKSLNSCCSANSPRHAASATAGVLQFDLRDRSYRVPCHIDGVTAAHARFALPPSKGRTAGSASFSGKAALQTLYSRLKHGCATALPSPSSLLRDPRREVVNKSPSVIWVAVVGTRNERNHGDPRVSFASSAQLWPPDPISSHAQRDGGYGGSLFTRNFMQTSWWLAMSCN